MLRKQRIQTQIVLVVVIALLILATVLQAINNTRQRAALVEAKRDQSLAIAGWARNTLSTVVTLLTERLGDDGGDGSPGLMTSIGTFTERFNPIFGSLAEDRPDIAFITLTVPAGVSMLHSDSELIGQPVEALRLGGIPLDETIRRDVPGFGDVYLTRVTLQTDALVPGTRMDFIVGMDAAPVSGQLFDNTLFSILIACGTVGLMSIAASWIVRRNITRPLQQVQAGTHIFSTGDLRHEIAIQGSPEVSELADTLNYMARNLQNSQEIVEALHRDIEKRVQAHDRDLAIATEIGHRATRIHDIHELMRETVQQIRARFEDIYHAQVFLLDNLNEYAVLVESTGEAGQKLLAVSHRLRVGSASVIGRVTERNEVVMASDTRRGEIDWQPNPMLPDTHAEMALPLSLDDRVIGALDVQSTQPDVFTDEMVQVFSIIADQLAIAIENARLLDESERRIAEIHQLNRQLTRTTWQDYATARAHQAPGGYVYNQRETFPLDGPSPASPAHSQVQAAIQVHGETIGRLTAALADGDDLTADDRILVEAVAERVSLALENARLFEQTQRSLAETERLYETARTVSSASDLTTIYQLVAEQLSVVPEVDHIDVLLSGPDPTLAQYLESVFSWDRQDPALSQATQERLRILPLTFATDDMLPRDVPLIFSDIRTATTRDHPLWPQFERLHAASGALIPVSAAGRWFGLIVCTTRQPANFDSTYLSFASALADQLAIAIDNRRLFEEAQTEARRARALAEAGQLASQIGGDFEAGLRNLFQAVAGPGDYDRWWFGLLDETHTTLAMVTTSPDLAELADIPLDDGGGALAEAARIGEIVLVNEPHDHPVIEQSDRRLIELYGKHIAMPVRVGEALVGVLLVGRSLHAANIDERDIQLAATLASQVAVATQNQQLFQQAESQRRNLQTILDTMPTGVLVMDAEGKVLLSNESLLDLLGPELRPDTPERPTPYPMLRTGTDEPYPRTEWPLSRVFATGNPALADDMTVQRPDGSVVNLLAQAVPITNAAGDVTAVVGAFQDITELQELERALQDSLRETTLLYEASRSISRATRMEEVLDVMLWQISTLTPDQVYIFLRKESTTNRFEAELAATEPSGLAPDLTICDLSALFGPDPIIYRRDAVPDAMAGCLAHLGVNTVGSFPLNVRGHTNGWIVIGYETANDITTEQRRFLTTLADQAAVTVENQRLLTRTEEALQDTAVLYQASRAIADVQNPADILDAFANFATLEPTIFAALYTLLPDSPESAAPTVELTAIQMQEPDGDPPDTRYALPDFAFRDEMMSPHYVIIDDVRTSDTISERARLALSALNILGAILIPLRAGERRLGMVVLGLASVWQPTESELRIYQSLADQAAISLENAQLYRQAQRRARRLTSSAEISRAVTSILSMDLLLPQVVDLIKDAFEYDHTQIFLINEAETDAELVASTGEAGEKLLALGHKLAVGSQSVIGQVTQTGQPEIALDTGDARFIHMPNPILPNTRSEMAIPLIARGQILGAIDVQSNQSRAFTDEDVRMLSSLADTVATAIDNARLFAVSQKHADDMAFLFRVTNAATTSADLDDALDQVVETVQRTLQVTNASIYLPNPEGQYLVHGADSQQQGAKTAFTSASIDRSLVGWVVRNEEAVIINDLEHDPRRLPGADTDTARAAMAVPLRTAGSMVGVLVVVSDQRDRFDAGQLRLLQTLSGSLAAVLQNSRLLREMQIANERLLEVDRLKTNFLAAMSHELRTPLNSIIGFSRVILKGIDGPLTDMQEQDLNTIYDSGKHLLGLVNDILDQAKIEAGKMELSFGYFKLDDVIKSVMSSAIGLTRDKTIQLNTEIADDLPEVYGDEFRTRQILLNLVSNAAKFTREGSVSVAAFPVMEDDQELIQVSVTDTGIGIAEKDMPLLFEAFQQVDNSLTREVEGTGMGLPLAKSLTELQGGRIWVESEVEIGSTFSFTVPLHPPAADDPEDDTAPADASAAGSVGALSPNGSGSARDASPADDAPPSGTVIIAVEDDPAVIALYRQYLAAERMSLIGVTDAEHAEEMVIQHRPVAVLLDVNMPNRDGWSVLENLKADPDTRDIPVIVCSINADPERCAHLGAAAYLLKPFTKAQLIETLRNLEAAPTTQTILLVDDVPESVRIYREALLAQNGYHVIQANDGREALDILHQPQPIDLVILDLRMPDVDGFAVVQSMRSEPRTAEIPVLVLTAEDITSDERSRLEAIDIYRKDDLDETGLLARVAAELNHANVAPEE